MVIALGESPKNTSNISLNIYSQPLFSHQVTSPFLRLAYSSPLMLFLMSISLRTLQMFYLQFQHQF